MSKNNRLVLKRLIDCDYNFVEENTKFRKVSDTFCTITRTLRTRFVQTEYKCCKLFCKSGVFFAKILQDSNISCKSLSMITHFLARSCKSFSNRVAFFLN